MINDNILILTVKSVKLTFPGTNFVWKKYYIYSHRLELWITLPVNIMNSTSRKQLYTLAVMILTVSVLVHNIGLSMQEDNNSTAATASTIIAELTTQSPAEPITTNTTDNTTAVAPTVTSEGTNGSTVAVTTGLDTNTTGNPETTTSKPPGPTPCPPRSGFDVGSFIGGIVLCAGVVAIVFLACKFYRNKSDRQYSQF